jgi:hypothetical protein
MMPWFPFNRPRSIDTPRTNDTIPLTVMGMLDMP